MPASNKYPEYDPAKVGAENGRLFGFPYELEDSAVAVLPLPWDVTASYGQGSSAGPEAILKASPQLDFYHPDLPDFWREGVFMQPVNPAWQKSNELQHELMRKYEDLLTAGKEGEADFEYLRERLKTAAESMLQEAEGIFHNWIEQDKLPILLGGEHSTSLALIRALAGHYDHFGVLQIDAHADLRKAYMGLEHSHASIMYNALQVPAVGKLVQVGVRDWCHEEQQRINDNPERITTWFDHEMKSMRFDGKTWSSLCKQIVAGLPDNVYISFDIDGLDPSLCPNTGTPVPGGLGFDEANYLIRAVVESGRTIIGCDLVEVAPGADEWDGNVGARLLYRMALQMFRSNRRR